MRYAGSAEPVEKHRVTLSLLSPTENSRDPGQGLEPSSLAHALQAAEANERALEHRLHRLHDPKGMQLLRGLRAHIADLKARMNKA